MSAAKSARAKTKLRVARSFGETSMRHGAEIAALVVSSDDAFVLAADGGQPGRAVAWDLATGAERASFRSRTYGLTSAAVSPDGGCVAIAGYDNQALVFDAKAGKRLAAITTKAAPHGLAFAPDGRSLLVGDDRVPRVHPTAWKGDRAPSKLEVKREGALKGHSSAITAAALSPDGKYAVTAAGDRKVKLHDVAKAKVLATLEGYASYAAFLPGGQQFLFAGWDRAAIVDVPSGKVRKELDIGMADCASMSADGKRFAYAIGRDEVVVRVIELASGKTVFERPFEPVRRVALTSSGDRVVVARTAMLAQGTSLDVWSVADGERVLPRGGGHLGGIAGIAVHEAMGRPMAISASADRTLKIWDVEAGLEVETIAGGHDGIGALAITRDGKRAITSHGFGRNNRLQRWDLAGLKDDGDLEVGELGTARALAISPDGKIAAASFVRRAALFDLATGARLVVLEKHKAQVDTIVFSSDGTRVITGAADHLVKVWRAADGKELHALSGHTSFVHALAVVGSDVVSAGGDLARWEIESGKRIAHATTSAHLEVLAASPDGVFLAGLRAFGTTMELWSLDPRGLTGPIAELALDEEPACLVFVGPRSILVGTKQGRIFRVEIE